MLGYVIFMKYLNILIKPASSLCNMHCKYCFYNNISSARSTFSHGIMSDDTMVKILDNMFDYLDKEDRVNFAFQGGEPSLAGLEWFRKFVENTSARKRKNSVSYSMQTNGILMNEDWCDFFRENNFLIGLSVDADRKIHDSNRLSHQNKGSFDDCMKTKELFDSEKVEYNILCVLTNELAKKPEKAWHYIISNNIRFIQFIPCIGYQDNSLRPALFAKFYTHLLPLWIAELEKGNFISVKQFDDTANFYLRGRPTACGIDGKCNNQYVIEADGSLYPCDFYCFDDYLLGNLCVNSFSEICEGVKARDFLSEKTETPEICKTCKYIDKCRRGCKRMRGIVYAGKDGVICGNKLFLDKCLVPLEHTVRKIFK